MTHDFITCLCHLLSPTSSYWTFTRTSRAEERQAWTARKGLSSLWLRWLKSEVL